MKKKKVLIIYAGGMPSSVIAKLVRENLNSRQVGDEYIVDSFDSYNGKNSLQKGEWDVYLMSPQIRMYYREVEKIARDTNQVIKTIPPKEYVPVLAKIQTIANLALEGLKEAESE